MHRFVAQAKIYETCVLSKLLYSLDSVWLLQAERLRLNAFHCRSLRRILGIPHSYISRVSNDEVLRRASATPLYDILASRQVALYNRIASSSAASFVREVLCNPDGTPRSWAANRRRGRPRQQWATEVRRMA